MNRTRAILLVSAALVLTAGSASAAGTAHVVGSSQVTDSQKELQQSITELNGALANLSAAEHAADEGIQSASPAHKERPLSAAPAPSNLLKAAQEVEEKAKAVKANADKIASSKNAGVQSIDGVPSAENNFKGDSLRWTTSVPIYPMKGGAMDLSQAYCLNAGNTVYGKSKDFTAAPKNDDSSGDKPAPNYLHVELDEGGGVFLPGTKTASVLPRDKDASGMSGCVSGTGAAKNLDISSEFFVAEDDAKAAEREGWDFGPLVVPFKFELSDKSAVVASASLGAYIGYRIPFLKALDLRPVLFAGLSNVPVEQTGSGGKPTTETFAGLSYGGGVIGTIKDSFSWGLVFGADHVNSIQQYKYQDKPWVSLVLGLSLSQ